MSSTKLNYNKQYEDAMSRFKSNMNKANNPANVSASPEPFTPTDFGAMKPGVETAPPPAPTYFKVPTEENVPDEWKRFSEVFGFAPPSGHDRKGPVYTTDEWPESLRPFIPEVNVNYYMPEEEVEALWNAHIDNDVVWLWGQSGTGKSSLEEQVAAYIKQPFLRFNGREDIESAELFGQLTVESGENGGTVWKDGLLTEGVKYGARVMMDEATLIPAGIWMGTQWLNEKGGKLMLTAKPATAGERLIDPDPRFRLTYADNTRGQGDDNGNFNGAGVMNTATLNRVGTTLEIKYLPKDKEMLVLKNIFGDQYEDEVLDDMCELARLLREAQASDNISLAFSLRSIESVLRKAWNYRTMGAFDALLRGFKEGYANLLPTDDENGAALNFFDMTFGAYKS